LTESPEAALTCLEILQPQHILHAIEPRLALSEPLPMRFQNESTMPISMSPIVSRRSKSNVSFSDNGDMMTSLPLCGLQSPARSWRRGVGRQLLERLDCDRLRRANFDRLVRIPQMTPFLPVFPRPRTPLNFLGLASIHLV
jgi:hypothetical protein